MKSKGTCTISARLSAPCETCGERAEPCQVIDHDEVDRDIEFQCARCCPEHGAPLLAAAEATS